MSTRRRLLMAIANQYPWLPYAMDYLYERLIPQTIDGHIVKDKAKLGTIYGNGVIENQLVRNGNFESTSNWAIVNGTFEVLSNIGTYTIETVGSNVYGNRIAQEISTQVAGHKVFVSLEVMSSRAGQRVGVSKESWGTGGAVVACSNANTWYKALAILEAPISYWVRILDYQNSQVGDTMSVRDAQLIDLTQEFGTGNEPTTTDDPRIKKILSRGYIPYNAGEYRPSIINAIEYHRLPSEFQEVEYLESTGTQYIDTGASITSDIVVKIAISLSQLGTQLQENIICSNGNYGRESFLLITTSRNMYWFGNYVSIKIDLETNKTYYLEITKTYIDVNGERIVCNDISTGNLFLLFADSRGFWGRIYSATIYHGNIMTRNFIPCYRKSDNVAGLYDLVNGVFYTNAGTGDFLVGNDVDTTSKIELPAPLSLDGAMNAHNTFEVTKTDYVFTRNVQKADMGSFTYIVSSIANTFYTDSLQLAIKKPASNADIANILNPLYRSVAREAVTTSTNMVMSVNTNGSVHFRNESYIDIVAFKTAMTGVPLYYELANPQVIHIPKRHLGYYVINSDMVVGDTIVLADIKPNAANLWCDFGTLSGTTLTITKNVSSGTTLFYETENETTDFINLLSIESGGNITADCDGALPNAELKFKWGKQ